MSEYKIHRVEGSKLMSNLPNKSSPSKLPVIVTFNSVKAAQVSNIASTRKYKHIPSVAATMTMAEVHKLAKRADVKQIEYDESVKAYSDGANYWYGTEKAHNDFGVEGDGDGNVSSYTKEDNTIAVIDTGIDASYVDLQGKVIGWYDVINRRTTPYDDNGHGTHVAGISAGADVGNEEYTGALHPALHLWA